MTVENQKIRFGLVGKKLGHSFSQGYFSEKFEVDQLSDFSYQNFEITSALEIIRLFDENPDLHGLNVTIPYKSDAIACCHRVECVADRVGAINTIVRDGEQLVGYNTDVIGFHLSLLPWLRTKKIQRALILGSGGAAQAVRFVLESLKMPYSVVSRTASKDKLTYSDLSVDLISKHQLIINTTPLGMAPDVTSFPEIPYDAIGADHYLFDLIYNPEKTLFLLKGVERSAQVKNGLEMLELQAEASWKIWKQYL